MSTYLGDVPLGVRSLKVGAVIEFWPIPTWYQRAWRWIKRVVMRRKLPNSVVHRITNIDYATRTVTYETEKA